MAVPEPMIAAWLVAIDRLRRARSGWLEWAGRNPCPIAVHFSEDFDEQAAAAMVESWEKGSDAVGGPYDEARETLLALPAPNLEAVIVKLQLVRETLETSDEDHMVTPALERIEEDIRWLANNADPQPREA